MCEQKVGLGLELSEVEKMDEACLLSLITVKLRPALWYQMWANKKNVSEVRRGKIDGVEDWVGLKGDGYGQRTMGGRRGQWMRS